MIYPAVLQRALELGVTNPPDRSLVHGEVHWKAVALTGFHLSRYMPVRVDMEFVYTFAMLHDTMREDDDADPLHGARAAHLFVRLVEGGLDAFAPYSQRTQDMMFALDGHVGTEHARDYPNPNVGVCWDADRLNLWRVGLTPDSRYLTTEVANTRSAQHVGWRLCEMQLNGTPFPSWDEIAMEVDANRWP